MATFFAVLAFIIGATVYTVSTIYSTSVEDGIPVHEVIVIWLGWIPLLLVEIGMDIYENLLGGN